MITPWNTIADPGSAPAPAEENSTTRGIFAQVRITPRPGESISSFADDVWDLRPMTARRVPPNSAQISFKDYPPAYRDTAKRLAWCSINLRTPIERIPRPKQGSRERLAARTIAQFMKEHAEVFLTWLDENGIEELASVKDQHLRLYVEYLKQQKFARNRVSRMLFGVTRIWLLSVYMPEPDQLMMPPWEKEGLEAHIGRYVSTPENRTLPIHPQTMSALLVWAERFVTIFANDIIAAAKLRNEIAARARRHVHDGDVERFQAYAESFASQGKALPGYTRRVAEGERELAQELISGTLDIGMRAMVPMYRKAVQGFEIGTTAPIPLELRGRLDGDDAPWLPFIDYYEARKLRARLATACFIITAYLSGMRGQEVTQLRRGCVRVDESPQGGPKRYSIRGLEFKSAIDEDGNLIPEGRIRDRPWHVVEPVAKAIALAESLSDSEYVFDWGQFVENGPETKHASPHHLRVNQNLEDFILWVNAYCARTGRLHESIPEDPQGRVNPTRFRRTLAWFIFRRPGGRVALGVQYGHLRGYTSEGYGSRSSAGLEGLYEMEEAFSVADHLSVASERLRNGEGVSGPAASRYIEGVTEFAREFSGKALTKRQMTALRSNPRMRIYENGLQPVACCYDATKALCHPENRHHQRADRTPDLTRCNPNCGNVARTDMHIATIRQEIADLHHESESPATPEPLQQRIRQRIENLERLVDRHESTKVSE